MSPLVWMSVCACFILIGSVCYKDKRRTSVFIMGLVYLIGAADFSVRMIVPQDDICRFTHGVQSFSGYIAEDPDVREDKTRALIRVDSAVLAGRHTRLSGLVAANISGNVNPVAYGDRVEITAHPYRPMPPTNPGQFSWKEYLEREGIRTCVSIKKPQDIRIYHNFSGNVVRQMAFICKDFFSDSVHKIIPRMEASVIAGMVLGTYSYLPEQTLDGFVRTGTLHLLAASGFNCAIIVIIASPVLTLLKVPPKPKTLIIIALITFYVMMIGAKPSLVRAAIMAGLWLLAVPLKRVPDIKNLFFIAIIVTLAIRPGDLYDVGFQLSYAAVWALITSASTIEAALSYFLAASKTRARQKKPSILALRTRQAANWAAGQASAAALATITVSLFTAPIVAYYFNYISLVSLPANILVAIGVEAVFIIGILAVPLAHVPYLCIALGFAGTWLTDGMLAIINFLSSGRYSAITVASPSILAVTGYYIVLLSLIGILRSKYAQA